MFNWVHRKFHYSPPKAESTQNVRKNTEFAMKEVHSQGLLKQVGEIVDVLDNWRINGSLKICTVGFEKSSKPRNLYGREYFILRKEDKRDKEVLGKVDDDDDSVQVDEELSPLMWTTFRNNFDDSGEYSTAFEKSQVIMAIDHVARRIRSSESDAEKKKSKGPRITLADLFMTDADVKPKTQAEEVLQDLHKTPDAQSTNTQSFSKKEKKEVEPRRNFRRLMRKMMKRKIHAEIDDKQLLMGERSLTDNDKYGKVLKPISILSIQGACV